MESIEELKKQIEELKQMVEQYEKGQKKSNVRWKPKRGEDYWYISDSADIHCAYWAEDPFDKWNYINHNVFKTEKEAERYKEYKLALAEASYEFSKEEWEDGEIDKWYLYYDYEDKNVRVSSCNIFSNQGGIYFKTYENCQAFIDKWHDEILKFEFGIEV